MNIKVRVGIWPCPNFDLMIDMSELNRIQFHYVDVRFAFNNRIRLKSFLLSQLVESRRQIEAINYIFCDDEYLLQMNQHYLKHDTLTDIITFELSLPKQPIIADIFISIPRVVGNAEQLRIPFNKELHRVVFHGMLHLLGLKDKTAKQALHMRAAEDALLSKYFVPRETDRLKD